MIQYDKSILFFLNSNNKMDNFFPSKCSVQQPFSHCNDFVLFAGFRFSIHIRFFKIYNTVLQTPFSVTYHPLFTSSIYDFKIISLPTADIEVDLNEETLAAQLRIKTGKTNSKLSWISIICIYLVKIRCVDAIILQGIKTLSICFS